MMTKTNEKKIDDLFSVGAHYGYSRSRRHPSVRPYLFGTKNSVEIFDLEKTADALSKAEAFAAELAASGKKILFVSSKFEARGIITNAAKSLGMPFVVGRWIGGTLTNFEEIKKRVRRLNDLRDGREKGEHDKFTKHERLLIDREIEMLDERFGGIAAMETLPAALFVIDPRHEHIAVAEAAEKNIPVIALASSDCDVSDVAYPIPANDSNQKSVEFFVRAIMAAYAAGSKK